MISGVYLLFRHPEGRHGDYDVSAALRPSDLDTKHSLLFQGLAFAELELLAGLGLAWLFAFDDASVSCHEALCFEGRLVVGVDFDEGSGDGESEGLSLSFYAAAVEVGLDVVALGYSECREGLLDDELECAVGEVAGEFPVVDFYFALTCGEVYSCDGCFPSAECVGYFCAH